MFTSADGQVYHLTVEGNTVKDSARIPPDVSSALLSHRCFNFVALIGRKPPGLCVVVASGH